MSLAWDTEGNNKFGTRLDLDFELLRCNVATNKPARLHGAVVHDNNTWVLGSVIKNLDFSNLYTLFAQDIRVTLTALFKFVRVSYLVLVYKYKADSQGQK
ncbi:hypothetical protein QQX98_008161 [Neonectria punicea]|uniref:Uncharacterized protein n=1 Tax=Neonectria punicea TaxID=979145 RepID=A0ABR1GWA9_9HYPO